MVLKIVITIITLFVLFLIWYFCPRHVKLELVSVIQNANINVNKENSNFGSELHWWFIEDYPYSESAPLGTISPDSNGRIIVSNSPNLDNWRIDFDGLGIDFSKNNVILGFSREIKEMEFKRADGFPYQSDSPVKTRISKKFESNTIYVYKIPKYEVREDLRAYTETFVEK